MKVFCKVILLILAFNFFSNKPLEEQKENKTLIIKYKILRPGRFPEFIFCDEFQNLIEPIRLQKKIFYRNGPNWNVGEWVDNPFYIEHDLVEKIISLDS